MGIDLATRLLLSNMNSIALEITEELIARQTAGAQAIIRALPPRIQQLQDRLNQSPRNSSVPRSTEHLYHHDSSSSPLRPEAHVLTAP